MKIKKALCCLLALPAIFFAATAHGGGKVEVAPDGTTVIRLAVANLPNSTSNDLFTRAETAALRHFVKTYPERFAKKYRDLYKSDPAKYGNYDWDKIELRVEPFSGISVEGVENDLLAIAGKMAPDVIFLNFRKSDNYVRNGFLYPLDEFIERLTPEEREDLYKNRVHEKIWPVIKRPGPGGNTHIWALPYDGTPLGKVLIYRKDLFDKKDIPYPDSNWTWDDMYDACVKITDPANGIYAFTSGRGKTEGWYFITFLWSAGADVMDYNEETDSWTCVFNTPEAVTALDFYTKLSAERWLDSTGVVRRGYTYKDSNSYNKWNNGEIAMKFDYISDKTLSTFNAEIHGVAPVPLGPTGIRGAELNSSMYGMFSEIESPVIRDAAWEFIFFRDSEDAMRIKTDMLVEGGMGQFISPKNLEKFGYDEFLRLAPKEWYELFDLALSTGKPEPYGKNSNFAYEQLSIPLQLAEHAAIEGNLPTSEEDAKLRGDMLQTYLNEAVARANELMIGDIPPAERAKRRIVAAIFIVCIAVAFFFVFRKIFRIFTPPVNEGEKSIKWGFRKYFWAYILLIPAVVTVLLWNYFPLARGTVMAFQDYKILGESTFVGLDNFGNLIFDNMWWQSVWNALRYSFLVMALTFLPPVILAILLHEVPKGKLMFRMIYYLPAVISGLVTIVLWKQFYEPSEFGMLNRLILNVPAICFIIVGALLFWVCLAFAKRLYFYQMWLAMTLFIVAGLILFFTVSSLSFPVLFPGYESFADTMKHFFPRLLQSNSEPYRWLFNPNTAMLACVIPSLWAGMGPGCLIYLAALKGIPDDYYEAADLDGATFIDKILFVVFPTLKAILIINFVGVFIGSWYNSTGNILVMTGGDAATKTETAGLFIWYKAFTYLNFGPATAAAWVLAFMLIGFTVYQLQILSKVEFRASGAKK